MMSADSLGSGSLSALDGIAAPLKESTTKSHRDDTIRAGAFLCDQDIVSKRISQATRQVDLLERWGVIFRRDPDGIPLVRRAAWHSLPRLAGAGDSMAQEIMSKLSSKTLLVNCRTGTVPLEEISNISSGLFFRRISLSSHAFEAKINAMRARMAYGHLLKL